MVLSALLGKKIGPKIGGIQIDVSIRESHSVSKTISDSPIEVGSDVSDHIKKDPDEVSLDGVLSNLPSSLLGRIELESSGDTAEKRYAELLDLVNNAETFELITGLRVYSNMVFKSFSVDRDNSTAENIRFRCVMREVEFAQSETVPVVPSEEDAGKAETKTDQGQKPKKPAPPAAATEATTAANNLLGGSPGAERLVGFIEQVLAP